MLIEAVHSKQHWLKDPSLLPIPFQVPDISQKKLRVGIMMHDGVVLPHPPVLRALNLAKEKLEASNEVEVVEYSAYNHREGYNITVSRARTYF
jgi:amidase